MKNCIASQEEDWKKGKALYELLLHFFLLLEQKPSF
jgi:hypothetical protein